MARFCARYHGAAPTPPDIAVANFRCESGAVASVTGYSRGENALARANLASYSNQISPAT